MVGQVRVGTGRHDDEGGQRMTGQETPLAETPEAEGKALPEVGDEIRDGTVLATVTDVRGGKVRLRTPGRKDWSPEHPDQVTVIRTREQRIADGDLLWR